MNVLLLVIDSLRAGALGKSNGPRTPFLDHLSRETVTFRRAYATECWTLPPTRACSPACCPPSTARTSRAWHTRPAPTVAELLAAAGFHTEVVTRNFIFDGSLPGVTRGFQHNTRSSPITARGIRFRCSWR